MNKEELEKEYEKTKAYKEAILQLKHYCNMTAYWKQQEFTNSEIDNYIKLVLNYISKLEKIINLMAEDRAEISEPKVSKEAIIDFYFKKVEEENE